MAALALSRPGTRAQGGREGGVDAHPAVVAKGRAANHDTDVALRVPEEEGW